MSAAVPLACKNCDGPLSPSDESCPSCKAPNPEFTRPALHVVEASTKKETAFESMLAELARAKATGCKIIANVGMSAAGKSWLIARMSKLRLGTHRVTLCSENSPPVTRPLQTGDQLGRTSRTQAYVWHLETTDQCQDTVSGNWRIIDIAGELVSDLRFIDNIAIGRPLYDLLIMTLAHVSALVLVIDGQEIAREDVDATAGPGILKRTIDEQNAAIMNELVRLIRFLHYWKTQTQAPVDVSQLLALKEQIRSNPNLDLGTVHGALGVPTLLLISKADALVRLTENSNAVFAAPGPDPLQFVERRLPRTHVMALNNINILRCGFAAPFVVPERPRKDSVGSAVIGPSDILDFERPSYGVRQALHWIDSELARPTTDTGLTAQRAMSRIRRWYPYATRRKLKL
jgi:hypothetical protein